MKVLYVNGQNAKYFDSENKKKPVFAKYFSPTCPACVAMENDWDEMCKDIDNKYDTDLIMAQIDPQGINELGNMNTYSDVQYVPTLILLENGQRVKEYNGPKKKDDLIHFLMENGLIKTKRVGGKRFKKRTHGKSRSIKGKRGKNSRRTYKRKNKKDYRRKTRRM
jgi:thiol-disulfide isomerase/thioredoxin